MTGRRMAGAVSVLALALAACAAPSSRAANPPDRDARTDASPQWIQLFNGRDLSGWTPKFAGYELGVNLHDTFRVENGVLAVRYDRWPGFSGEFGHLFYRQPFSHYVVAVEYRFVGEQVTGAGARNAWAIRNNGIMAHSQAPETMGRDQDFPISLEIQLLGGLGQGARTTANLCTPGTHVMMEGRLVRSHCINSRSGTFDGDQWVRVEALVLGDSIVRHIVNGDTVLTYASPQMGGGNANNLVPGVMQEGRLLASGYIALQAETAPVEFRKVELLNLSGCMDPKSSSYRHHYVHADPTACR